MTKITRPSKNIVAFGSNAEGTERTTFGTTTQANDLDSNLNDSFARGWGIVAGSDLPTKQDFNAMGYTLGQLNAYLYQMGIAEYDAAQEYHQNSFTNYNGVIYKSLTNNNVGNTPNTSTTNWESVIDGKYLPLTGGTLTGDLTAPNITANTSLTVGSAKATYSATGLNFDKPLLINGAAVLKAGDAVPFIGLIPAGTDLNTLIGSKNGVYYQTYSANATLVLNYPVAGRVGALVVYSLNGQTSCSQRFMVYGTNDEYLRNYNQNTSSWTSWDKIITTANVGSYTSSGLGYDQTWQDMTSDRRVGVNYINTTGKPIEIKVNVLADGSNASVTLLINDVQVEYHGSSSRLYCCLTSVIPNGATYKISGLNPAIVSFFELR